MVVIRRGGLHLRQPYWFGECAEPDGLGAEVNRVMRRRPDGPSLRLSLIARMKEGHPSLQHLSSDRRHKCAKKWHVLLLYNILPNRWNSAMLCSRRVTLSKSALALGPPLFFPPRVDFDFLSATHANCSALTTARISPSAASTMRSIMSRDGGLLREVALATAERARRM